MSLSVLEVVSQEDLKVRIVRIETQKRQQTQMRLKGNVLSRLDQAFDAVYELFDFSRSTATASYLVPSRRSRVH